MNTKLTLTLEKDVIEIAKRYAKDKGQSLSELVENYFKLLTADKRKIKAEELSPRVQRLRGILKVTGELDTKEALTEELMQKYGR